MKDYPIDRFAPVTFWPMELATKVSSKLLKLLLVLVYFPWFLLMMPIMAPLLVISIAMAVWDDVNNR